ncbi:hypothetical protein [Dyadobacter sp. CY312]|uniref:hypothetical protein n=1 Tax=Dyadobacter sp. CY312 TaxID=2907303 RepID=UPI001F445C14|nr:hypothetical protein [Dyadobacter sp. CY312]MCE7039002.1 hypothetical protein [Dyadobacter sp. CY312]
MPEIAEKSKTPFQGVTARSISDMEEEAKRLLETVQAQRAEKYRQDQERQERKKASDLEELNVLRFELDNLDEAAKLAGNLSLSDAKKLSGQRTELLHKISKIESEYQITQTGFEEAQQVKAEKKTQAGHLRATVLKVGGIISMCGIFVLFSGNWILGKYPNAAIYNEVSFQKVLFGFAVFICAVAAVIAALSVFFPGIAKYFNPFNSKQLDFYDDFTTLSAWQRNIISLALFSLLLLAFVMTVSGKLD